MSDERLVSILLDPANQVKRGTHTLIGQAALSAVMREFDLDEVQAASCITAWVEAHDGVDLSRQATASRGLRPERRFAPPRQWIREWELAPASDGASGSR